MSLARGLSTAAHPDAAPDQAAQTDRSAHGASRSVARNGAAPACAFVIFGITGDLAARKLIPALYQLHVNGELDARTVIVGFGRKPLTDAELTGNLHEALAREVPDLDEGAWRSLAGRISYVHGDYASAEAFGRLAAALEDLDVAGRVYYTATPPGVYGAIARSLAGAGLARASEGRFSRLVVEKPFGTDAASAKALNEELLEYFSEQQLYRIDHYLAKETAQNLGVLRFANSMFEPFWNNRYIDHVQITMIEPMGVEGRGQFYEDAGILRDVFQNHLLQLLALIAMEPPVRFDARSMRDEKVKLFSAVACPNPQETVLGQYVAGNGMAGYRQEPGVDPRSRQATFAAMHLTVENWRWGGVPFYLRSGKRLEAKASEIVLQFKAPPHVPFTLPSPVRPDRLILRIVPDEGISIRFNGKRPGQRVELGRISLDFSYRESFDGAIPDAYETLLLDVMEGDATLFMRADEVEAQWAIIDPLLEYATAPGTTPLFYEAGGRGPKAAYALLESVGRSWKRPAGVKTD